MASIQHPSGFAKVMAGHGTAQLLTILRQQQDYVPAAIEAALAELSKRNISAFDVNNAIDDHFMGIAARNAIADLPLRPNQMLIWLLFPFLALSPLGIRFFQNAVQNGERRRSIQFLELATIGFTGYMTLILLYLNCR
jgi:hypothetical protein